MKEIKYISSTQNKFIKQLLLLKEKSRERKKSGLFVFEGLRELQLAIKGGYAIDSIFFNPDIITESDLRPLFKGLNALPNLVEVSKEVYQKMAHRETTEGVFVIAKAKTHTLGQLKLTSHPPLVLVAEALEKPGNIGALLRTADAANLDAVLIANPKTDMYNPNIIRSSVGCIFTTQIGMGSTQEILTYLQEKNMAVYCAALEPGSENYTKTDFTQASAIVVGTESTGLSNTWLRNSSKNIKIPMQGEIDSLNVSVSAAILIFEAKRQRGYK